jgi:hypothetical protein
MVILDSLEEDMLADLLELKSVVSAPLSAAMDGGSISTMYYKLHANRKGPWLFDYMEELTSGSSRNKATSKSSTSQEAERLIDLWKQVQEQKKNKK